MKRINITQHDVFISWTGKDRALKNTIVEYLESKGITCLESDHDCSGDFRQWSHEAVNACNVFLLIGSENAFDSEYVPVEIEEFFKWEDYHNRIVPVFKDINLYSNEPWGVSEFASATFLDDLNDIDNKLEEILRKVQFCNVNLLDKVYRNAMKTNYIRLNPLYKTRKIKDREVDFSNLYIERIVAKKKDEGQSTETYDASVFVKKSNDIFFISGPAGIGKTCYINQIRETTDKETVTFVLSCYKYADSADDVFEAMYKEFCRGCGNKHYYSRENFKSLLNNRHVLLVLDAMDEIPTVESTRKLIKKIEKYYRVNKENTSLIFTGRNENDADLVSMAGDKVSSYVLGKLSEDDIRILSYRLLSLLGKEEKKEEFFDGINNLDDQIKTNPLLVSQLAIIYEEKEMIPQTIVGICDAISEIMLAFDNYVEMDIPENYKDMVTKKLPDILKEFSAERYTLQSSGKVTEISKIFCSVLKSRYREERKERAEFLVEYLQNRAIIIDGEFYHKMFLEYYTATYYFEKTFNDYDEIEDESIIEELFSHYKNPYWSIVLKMFLMKADESIDEYTARRLFSKLVTLDIREYTLLFDTCRELIKNKETAQKVLVRDMVLKSVDGTYPPYGPLFWYISEYNLYDILILVLDSLKKDKDFAKMAALVRDVCFIMGRKYAANEITERVDVYDIYEVAKSELTGVRKALCELFYLGETDYKDGDDIYPRCFNVKESQNFMENDCGVLGVMNTPFKDELGLYKETAYNELEDECIGLVSCPYIISEMELVLNQKSCKKLRGMILTPSKNRKMSYISFNRTHLEVMYIPENIEHYQNEWNKSLELSITIGKNKQNKMYVGENIKLFIGTEKFSDHMFERCTSIKEVLFSEGINVIRAQMFRECYNLEYIDIPKSVIEIESEAFEKCTKLTTISLPKELTKIGDGAFGGCRSLYSVNLPLGITVIREGVFEGCSNLNDIVIPDGVTEIGSYAFSGCESLVALHIPRTVQLIWHSAFSMCVNLKEINIPEGIKYIYPCLFMGCSSLEMIEIPKSVKWIFDAAFNGCNRLKRILLPKGLEFIGNHAFYECNNLKMNEIPTNVSGIGEEAFIGCAKIEEIIISSTTMIQANTFEEATTLIMRNKNQVNLELPYGKIRIEESEFENRKDIDSITIPRTVTEIGEAAFKGCINLLSITIPSGVKEVGNDAFNDCINIKKVVIPDSTIRIGYRAFDNCTKLTSVNIPDSVTEIDAFAFAKCTSLTSIYIPKGVRKIAEGILHDCCNLTSIHIPKEVRCIGANAFYGCVSLKAISIPIGISKISEGTFGNCKSLKTIKIPEGVEEIWDYAFLECNGLESIYIPESVKGMGIGVFEECTSLKFVNIPKKLTRIEADTFKGCRSLSLICIPENIIKIECRAFMECISLCSIDVPKGVTEIGAGAFEECINLKSIDIPDSVTQIGAWAFEECRLLDSIHIPNGIIKIEMAIFRNCISLSIINIPEGVTEIQCNAFENCEKLKSIAIPQSVRIIGDNAFSGCSALASITISRRYEDDIQRIFGDIDRNIITFI